MKPRMAELKGFILSTLVNVNHINKMFRFLFQQCGAEQCGAEQCRAEQCETERFISKL